MSVTLLWGNEQQTIIQYEFDEYWKIDELRRAIELSVPAIDEATHTIDIVFDMSECTSPPANLTQLRNHLLQLDAEKIGVVVVVTRNHYIQNIMQLLNKLLRNHFKLHFTDTLDNSYRIIYRAMTTREGRVSS